MNNIFTQFTGVAPGGNIPMLGGSQGGALAAFEELQKALQASDYTTDTANLTGGGALGVQSLDTAMKTVIQENEHFVLFNRLNKGGRAINIVDEYTRQNGVGGFPGGSTNTQMGVVRAAQGEYSREIGLVKFLMSMRQVGYVLNIGKNIAEPMAVEERNGALQLLTDAEYLLFHGNADVSPTQFDGIFAQIDKEIAAGSMSSENVYDMNGTKLDDVKPFSEVNRIVSAYGSWGRITDVYLPNSVQTDLNLGLDPAYRWTPEGGNTPMLGGHVNQIRLTHGNLKTNMDTFIHDETMPMVKPFEVTYSATATANVGIKPASLAGTPTSDASSRFTTGRDGNYYYAVEAIDADGKGMSALTKSAAVAVAVGEKVTLTITQSSATSESGYRVFRSKQNGTNTTADFRLMGVVKRAGATTPYVDLNREMPGTVRVPLLNLGPSADAIDWRQFQPMTKIPLPFGVGGIAQYSWFQFLFGYLRMTKPKHHGYIKNILPSDATWRPHTDE
jgi:hypothetical protein